MSRTEFKAGYPEGPPCFYLLAKNGEFVYPALIFCREECRGEWLTTNRLENNNQIPGMRTNCPWRFVKKSPQCANCGLHLYKEK